MSNIYTCFASIIGLNLPEKTTFTFNEYIITNDPDVIIDSFIPDPIDFITMFGTINYNRITKGRPFLIFTVQLNNLSEPHIYIQIASQTIMQLWRIKDNSIFIDDFSFYATNGPMSNVTKFNYNIYNSKGNAEETSFNENDFKQCAGYLNQLSDFFVPKNTSLTKEDIPHVNIHLSHKQLHYNDVPKFERAMQFQWKGRSESSIPMKITNYISFLECLFSSAGAELQHQVSERVSLFLYKYDKNINKLETFKLIKSCYGIRSKYVHGDKLDKKFKTLEALQETSVKLDDVCRKVINTILNEKLVFFNDDDLSVYFLDLIFDN